uniref:Uncharacterized protein n=1 Tax=Nelumbo nucifera TaxID=4432 RepID=A0A822Y659_NELNU|nr:TPA_asm: hypothetical protein HUJ06_029468 [Nelumbo nucifera]
MKDISCLKSLLSKRSGRSLYFCSSKVAVAEYWSKESQSSASSALDTTTKAVCFIVLENFDKNEMILVQGVGISQENRQA